MILAAEKLAEDFDYIRVDMYSNGESFLVGELTNVHGNAHEKIIKGDVDLERHLFNG